MDMLDKVKKEVEIIKQTLDEMVENLKDSDEDELEIVYLALKIQNKEYLRSKE